MLAADGLNLGRAFCSMPAAKTLYFLYGSANKFFEATLQAVKAMKRSGHANVLALICRPANGVLLCGPYYFRLELEKKD